MSAGETPVVLDSIFRETQWHRHLQAWFAKDDAEFLLLGGPRIDERAVLLANYPPVLLIGAPTSTAAAVARMSRYLRQPLVHWHPSTAVEPPPAVIGTLVIWEVDTLNEMQQALLLRRMDNHGADVQVISVASRPLFPLVLEEAFLDTLYYRLNIVCLVSADAAAPASVSAQSQSGETVRHQVEQGRGDLSHSRTPRRHESAA